ncbi:MAG: GNAT family N-acetyltransferase [Candidatus Brocadia sp.]|nr:GNAT family N-acetyltransferase [Candidatus Brocadia sp.]
MERFTMQHTTPARFIIRSARPEDADSMAALYKETYLVANSGSCGERYPFPQFMDPLWFANNLIRKEFCWIVAEAFGKVIGCFGVLRNIGSPGSEDRIAEQTGLVVNEKWRRLGVATGLMAELCKRIKDATHFIIAEARTANPGGWKVAKKHGFVPIGFEPLAHMTDSGHEPMLVLGKLSDTAIKNRSIDYTVSVKVQKLAKKVCRLFSINCPQANESIPYPITFDSWRELRNILVPVHPVFDKTNFEEKGDFRIVSDISNNDQLPKMELNLIGNHNSGIVRLKRLEGKDPNSKRYSEKYFLVFYKKDLLAVGRISWDHLDCRARILSLQSKFHGLQGILIANIVQSLKQLTRNNDLQTIVLDVRADFSSLHVSLEQLGFFPTIYYPSFISKNSERIDAVQYTLILEDNIDKHFESVKFLDANCLDVMNTVQNMKD